MHILRLAALAATVPALLNPSALAPASAVAKDEPLPCRRIVGTSWDCSDDPSLIYRLASDLAKARASAPAVKITVKSRITGYSYADSCHNIRDGKCLMANGKPVHVGAAACPYWLPLGTTIRALGSTYTCADRTAHWVQAKWSATPTFDLFRESCATGCGVSYGTVDILTDN